MTKIVLKDIGEIIVKENFSTISGHLVPFNHKWIYVTTGIENEENQSTLINADQIIYIKKL